MGKLYLFPTTLSQDTLSFFDQEYYHNILSKTDEFWVENLRTARRFLSAINIAQPIPELHFRELTKKTNDELVHNWIKNGREKTIVVMSEAGCPGIADPGAVAVQYAHQYNWEVHPMIGPSSILLALMASGMSGQRFEFHGYLPIDRKERVDALKFLEKESKKHQKAQIFMETPYRNNQMIESITQHCDRSTVLCIASEVTSKDEVARTKTVRDWKKTKVDCHKKPVIFVLQSF